MKRLALVSSLAIAGLLGPTTFDECILANMRGVGSDVAARAVAASCAKQFLQPKPAERSAPAAPVPANTDNGTPPRITDPSGRFTDFRPDPPK